MKNNLFKVVSIMLAILLLVPTGQISAQQEVKPTSIGNALGITGNFTINDLEFVNTPKGKIIKGIKLDTFNRLPKGFDLAFVISKSMGVYKLESIYLPETPQKFKKEFPIKAIALDGVVEIGENAFNGLTNINMLRVEGANKIEANAFKNSLDLKKDTPWSEGISYFNENVSYIGDRAFKTDNINQEQVFQAYTDNVIYIGEEAFLNMIFQKDFQHFGKLENLGKGSFNNTNLNSIILYKNFKSNGPAFEGSSLKSVDVRGSVKVKELKETADDNGSLLDNIVNGFDLNISSDIGVYPAIYVNERKTKNYVPTQILIEKMMEKQGYGGLSFNVDLDNKQNHPIKVTFGSSNNKEFLRTTNFIKVNVNEDYYTPEDVLIGGSRVNVVSEVMRQLKTLKEFGGNLEESIRSANNGNNINRNILNLRVKNGKLYNPKSESYMRKNNINGDFDNLSYIVINNNEDSIILVIEWSGGDNYSITPKDYKEIYQAYKEKGYDYSRLTKFDLFNNADNISEMGTPNATQLPNNMEESGYEEINYTKDSFIAMPAILRVTDSNNRQAYREQFMMLPNVDFRNQMEAYRVDSVRFKQQVNDPNKVPAQEILSSIKNIRGSEQLSILDENDLPYFNSELGTYTVKVKVVMEADGYLDTDNNGKFKKVKVERIINVPVIIEKDKKSFNVVIESVNKNGANGRLVSQKKSYSKGERVVIEIISDSSNTLDYWEIEPTAIMYMDTTNSDKNSISFDMVEQEVKVKAVFTKGENTEHGIYVINDGILILNEMKGTAREGEEVQVEAIDNKDYYFHSWGGDVNYKNPLNRKTSFLMPNKNVTVVVESREKRSLTVIESNGGYVFETPDEKLIPGQSVRIVAGEDEGYRFIGWRSSEILSINGSTDKVLRFTMPDNNVTIYADFELITEEDIPQYYRKVTYVTEGDGQVVSYPTEKVKGDIVEVNATIMSGRVNRVRTEGLKNEFNPTIQNKKVLGNFTMPDNDVKIIFETSVRKYINQDVRGEGYIISKNLAFQGDYVDIEAVPEEGSKFLEWESNFGDIFTDKYSKTTSFKMPNTDVTITAIFERNVKNIGYELSEGISRVAINKESAISGENINIEAFLEEGYEFVKWTSKEGFVEFSDEKNISTSFIMPSSNVVLIPRAKRIEQKIEEFDIIVRKTVGGSALANTVKSAPNYTISLKAIPDENFRFVRWNVFEPSTLVIDNPLSNNTSFIMANSNVTIEAVFEKISTPEPTPEPAPEPAPEPEPTPEPKIPEINNPFRVWKEQTNVEQDKVFKIKFNLEINPISLNKQTVYIVKENDLYNKISITMGTLDRNTAVFVYSNKTLESGSRYFLVIQNITTKNGKMLKENILMPFTVE